MDNFAAASLGFMILFGLVTLAISLAIAIMYILTLRKALTRCAPQNRATSPDSAWLLLIPLFNLVWQFILYNNIAESLTREFRQRNMPFEASSVKNLGLAVAILNVCCLIPVINIFAGIGALICLIMYWVKIAGYSSQIATPATVVQTVVQG